MNLYSLRNYFTNNGAVWLKLNGSDLENMISKIIDYNRFDLNDKNILDLGCGTGTMLRYAVDNHQCIAFGVDLIRLNIHQAKKIQKEFYLKNDIPTASFELFKSKDSSQALRFLERATGTGGG